MSVVDSPGLVIFFFIRYMMSDIIYCSGKVEHLTNSFLVRVIEHLISSVTKFIISTGSVVPCWAVASHFVIDFSAMLDHMNVERPMLSTTLSKWICTELSCRMWKAYIYMYMYMYIYIIYIYICICIYIYYIYIYMYVVKTIQCAHPPHHHNGFVAICWPKSQAIVIVVLQ